MPNNVTYLTDEEYDQAIEAAQMEFESQGLGFFGGVSKARITLNKYKKNELSKNNNLA